MSDDLLAKGREMQGKLWPQVTAPAADGDTPRPALPAAQLAPEFYKYVTETAFGTIWARPGLPLRDRSMITVAVLAALGHHEELKLHLRGARNLGLSKDELVEVLMHMSVYAGVPAGNAAMRAAAEVLLDADNEKG